MFHALLDVVVEEFFAVVVPRTLVLQNRRLGIFLKLLQVSSCIVAVAFFFQSHFFQQPHEVDAWGVGLWFEEGTSGGEATPDCSDIVGYAHHQGITGFSYKPTACRVLPTEETLVTQSSGLFLTTFVDDSTVWQGKDSACGAVGQELCEKMNGSLAAVYEEVPGSGTCSCTFHEQFLVSNVGERRIRFSYGYEVDLTDGRRAGLIRGGLLSSANSEGPPHKLKEQASDLVTEFLAPDGTACNFGGKSQWQHADSVGGVSGTFSELLNCAGVTLDSRPASLLAGNMPAPPHLRTMGFKIQLHVEIRQQLLGGKRAYVRTEAVPQVTARWDSNAQVSVFPATAASGTRRRWRRAHGVAVGVRVMGRIYAFDWISFVKGLLDVAILLHVPRFIVYFVAMRMMGLTSQVYRHSARTKLCIFAKFHNSVAKLMLAEVAFRGLIGDFHSSMVDLCGLRQRKLRLRLADIFMEQTNSGLLQPKEIKTMAAVVFEQMDKDASGEICCSEFIQACTDDGEISLRMLARFFGADKIGSRARSLLDSTVSETRRSEQTARIETPSGSASVVHCADVPVAPVLQTISEAELSCSSEADSAFQKEVPQQLPVPDMNTQFAVADHVLEKERQPVANTTFEKEVSIPQLVKRLQNLERHCEEALGALRDAATKSPSPPQIPLPPHVCPTLSQLPTNSFGSATQASHVPLPTSLVSPVIFASPRSVSIEQKLLNAAPRRMRRRSDVGVNVYSI